MTRARLGQHWLVDKNYIRKITDAVNLTPDDTCIEIGGGKGSLTREIASRCRRLIVYEIDPNWAEHLRIYSPAWSGNIEVREIDALKIAWDRTELGLSAGEPLVITGNLPYYITSPLLLRIAYSRLDFQRAIFLIQKEVADKISSSPSDSDYGRLTVSLGAFLETRPLFTVSPAAFKPPPKVMSSLIQMAPREKLLVPAELADSFERLVQSAFHMRRKTLKNNLHAAYPDKSVAEIAEVIQCMGINPSARAQELSVEQFVILTKVLFQRPQNNG